VAKADYNHSSTPAQESIMESFIALVRPLTEAERLALQKAGLVVNPPQEPAPTWLNHTEQGASSFNWGDPLSLVM
jgi:hypothetical protein